MTESQIRAAECRLFWCICGELRQAVEDDQQDLIDYHLSEIESISINTEQPALARRCRAVMVEQQGRAVGSG